MKMVEAKLDDREAFYAWVEAGSLDRASKLLASRGSYNPNTGSDWHYGSVQQAANRFILNFPDEAKEVFIKHGTKMNDKQWCAKLVIRACKAYSRKRFIEWVENNPWALEFPVLIDRRFPGLATVLKENVASNLQS